MATTVGSHSVSAFATPVNGGPLDANVVRGNDNTIRTAYVAHDADTGIHVQSSSLASRPTAGTAGRKWITVDTGSYKLWYDDGTTWHEVGTANIDVFVIADENLVKGDIVKVTGYNSGAGAPRVAKVSSASDVAFGIINQTIASGATGYLTNTGIIADVATNTFAVGDILYPNTSGGLTTTKPTSGNYQPSAFVLRSNSNNGVLYVEFSAPRIVERSDNTASTIVLRDASGNFSAGTITAGAVTSTGLVTFASLKGTGATTVTNILDEDNMASDSATALATQQSIKAYVDAKVATVDTLAEVLANGNTTGANDIIVTAGQKITTDTIAETTAAAGVTIDSVLLKDDVVNATDIEVDTISANNGTLAVTLASTGVATIAQQPILSSLTASQAVFTDSSKGLVSNAITGTGNVVMSASPTLTGTVTAATINATTLGGTLSTAAQTNITSVGTLSSLAVTGNLTLGADVVLSRGAANRLDLASGDSMNVVSGDYQIGGTSVLSSNTLGSGVTASSLTSVGTLSSLTVSGAITSTLTSGIVLTNTSGGTNATQFRLNNTGGDMRIGIESSAGQAIQTGTSAYAAVFGNQANYPTQFTTNGTVRMTLDASGNLGLGVTPSTWSAGKAIERGFAGTADWGFSQASSYRTTNAYYNSGWKYGGTGAASNYAQEAGVHTWSSAVSGTAGNAITFTDLMKLDASGNLGVGTASPSGTGKTVEVSGSGDATVKVTGGTGGNAYLQLNAGSSSNAYINSVGSGALIFGANGVASSHARITSGGDFAINSNNKFYIDGSAATGDTYLIESATNVASLYTGGSESLYVASSQFKALGAYNNTTGSAANVWVGAGGDMARSTSSVRYKHDIESVDEQDAFDAVLAMRPITYRGKTDEDQRRYIGFLAEEMQEIAPLLCTYDEGGEAGTPNYVTYDRVAAYLVCAIQKQQRTIEALEARLEALEA